ncbi:MAG: GNAT family N-acetyltransferase [Bacteroidetes bacterium]|nr:MAG: GNAT family N-acetyltransferase [Bacteroidota bacterium]
MGVEITIDLANSADRLKSIFEVRRQVFVEEQEVSEEEEYDDFETSSTHLRAIVNGQVVGTCRYRNTDKGIKLERFAVLKENRRDGVGAALVLKVLEIIDMSQYIYLHAQIQVVDFYTKYGFVQEGEQFEEAGIQHYKMVFRPEAT